MVYEVVDNVCDEGEGVCLRVLSARRVTDTAADLESVEHEGQLEVVEKIQHHVRDQQARGEQSHERVTPTHFFNSAKITGASRKPAVFSNLRSQ